MRCVCGHILEIFPVDNGRRLGCPACRRPFDVGFTKDAHGGRPIVSLRYPEDSHGKADTDVGASTTSFLVPAGADASPSNPHNLAMEPEPPDEVHFRCDCGRLLAVPKSLFEKRVRCPSCKSRRVVFVIFDHGSKAFVFQSFSLIDAKSGKTQVLSAL